METGSLGLPRLFDRGKAASPCTSPTHLMFQGNSCSPYSVVPQQTPTHPTGPSSNALATEQPSLHSLGQRSVHLSLCDSNVPELWLVLRVSVSLVDWRLPPSLLHRVAQPRAWHLPGGVWEHSAEWILTKRKKQTSAVDWAHVCQHGDCKVNRFCPNGPPPSFSLETTFQTPYLYPLRRFISLKRILTLFLVTVLFFFTNPRSSDLRCFCFL